MFVSSVLNISLIYSPFSLYACPSLYSHSLFAISFARLPVSLIQSGLAFWLGPLKPRARFALAFSFIDNSAKVFGLFSWPNSFKFVDPSGSLQEIILQPNYNGKYDIKIKSIEGLINNLERRYSNTKSAGMREWIEKFMAILPLEIVVPISL